MGKGSAPTECYVDTITKNNNNDRLPHLLRLSGNSFGVHNSPSMTYIRVEKNNWQEMRFC